MSGRALEQAEIIGRYSMAPTRNVGDSFDSGWLNVGWAVI